MDPLVLALVLAAAVCHAGWNALIKSGDAPWVRMATMMAVSGVCGTAMIPFFPMPDAAVWPYLLGSALIHQVYFTTVCLGYRLGDLSQVYPIQRGIAPFLVAAGAYFAAGETLNSAGIVGVAVIGLAIISLATGKRGDSVNTKAITCALGTGTMIATYTVLDGLGGRQAESIFGYIAWLMVIGAVPFGLSVAFMNRKTPLAELAPDIRIGVFGGLLSFAAYASVIWALSITPMTYVSALRETSVVIAAFIGSRLLHEPFGGRRIAAAACVAAGVILLQVSRAG